MNTLKPKAIASISVVCLSIFLVIAMQNLQIAEQPNGHKNPGSTIQIKMKKDTKLIRTPGLGEATYMLENSIQRDQETKAQEFAQMLNDLSPENVNRISNKTKVISRCPECLEMLKNTLLSRHLSLEKTSELAMALTADNQLAIANMLLLAAKDSINTFGYDAYTYALVDALSNFDSPQIARSFLDYYLEESGRSDSSNSDDLNETLLHSIRRTSDFEAVGSDIAKVYLTAEPEIQNKILEINHPQAVANIISANSNDVINLFESLKNNPDNRVPAALMNLLKNDAFSITDISQAAVEWSAKFAGLDAVTNTENLLLENPLSQSETDLLKNILSNSPETEAQTVLEKYEQSHFE